MKRLVILLAAVATAFGFKTLDPLSDEFIEAINNAQPHWKAGRNFHRDTPMSYIEILLGTLPEIPHNPPMQYHDARHIEIPTSFDAREEWPHCPSIGEIRDQGSCGSCWAVATAEAITDRICIHSNGTLNFRVSAQDLLSCCNFCDRGNGCEGGWPGRAWQYWVEEGIVSGGPYGSNQGCRPYEEKPCEHDNRIQSSLPICDGILPNPECVQECEPGYTIPYHKDRIFGQNWYKLNMDPEQIQLEIMKNGPVGASFRVYEDFGLYYTGGVYYHTMGKELDGHSVKIIGWGVKDNLPYWLVANSWNTHWGDKGYFKILRGINECKIENGIVAGIPKIEHV